MGWTIRSNQATANIAQLNDFSHVDGAIVSRDFDVWLSSMIIEPDSDVTDHETTVPHRADEDVLLRIEVILVEKADVKI